MLAFFQGNRYLLSDLVNHVTDRVPIGAPLFDLYAGVGLFSVAAAVLRGASGAAVEGDETAFDDLSSNAAAAGAKLTTIRASIEGVGDSLAKPKPARPTLRELANRAARRRSKSSSSIRRGPACRPMRSRSCSRMKAPRLIYVSCDVATLARDARKIVDAGYAIDRADAFDMFPNTPHVETVVVFDRA